MTPVTDPALISQLEGASAGLTPVTDSALISQLDGNTAQPAVSPSFLPRVGADALAGLAQMGHGLINAPHNIVSYFNPQMGANIPAQQDYNYSAMLGVNAPNIGDKLIQGAAQYAPYMLGGEAVLAAKGGAASLPLVTRLATRGTVGGTFGATQSQNPVTGAAVGVGLNAAGELAPAAISSTKNLISNSLNAIQPQKYAEQLMQALGGGNTLEGNAQALAQGIQGAFNNRVNQGSAIFKPVFDALGDNSIYDGVNQAAVRQPVSNFKNINEVLDHVNDTMGTDLESASDLKDLLMQKYGYSLPANKNVLDFFNSAPAVVNNGAYNTLDNGIIDSYDRNLTNLHQQFTDNPTLQNAHDLQSQLGSSIRKLQSSDARGNLSVADRSTMQGYQQAQGALRTDINSFLTNQNPALADQYNLGMSNWAQNVTPYLENPKIAQIAKGDVTNPTAINNLFKNPEPEVQQIVNDVGSQANNQILYSELGKTQANLTPEKLVTAFNNLDNKGLSSYVTPDLTQQLEQLSSKITARNNTRTAAGAIVGGHFGGPLGAAAGAVAAPVFSKATQYLPSLRNQLISNALTSAGTAYQPAMNAITANAVNKTGGQ